MLQGWNASPLVLANAATQAFSASGDVDVKNKVTLTTGEQTITSRTGNILFTAGAAANEAIVLTASGRQLISTDSGTGGNIVAQGGSTDGTSVTFTFNGASNGNVDSNNAEQQIEARG